MTERKESELPSPRVIQVYCVDEKTIAKPQLEYNKTKLINVTAHPLSSPFEESRFQAETNLFDPKNEMWEGEQQVLGFRREGGNSPSELAATFFAVCSKNLAPSLLQHQLPSYVINFSIPDGLSDVSNDLGSTKYRALTEQEKEEFLQYLRTRANIASVIQLPS